MAPKGNKNGVGHGRPPNPGFEDKDLIRIGEAMLKWLDEPNEKGKPRKVHLSQFYIDVENIAPSQWDSLCHRACFLPYYEKAKKKMGTILLNNDKLPTAYGSRFLGIYFDEVKEHERKVIEHQVDYEIEKKAKMDNSANSPKHALISMLLEEIKSLKTKLESQERNDKPESV